MSNSKILAGFGVVVLAAGRGSRMGTRMGQVPKLLLPLSDGKPILWHAVSNAVSLGPSETVVVVRPDLPELKEALAAFPVRCVPNARYIEGMGTSLAVGIGALSDGIEAALVMLGDEPNISAHIVEGLVSAFQRERKPITVPFYGDQVGPPTLFSREVFSELLALKGDIGGRQLISKYADLVCRVRFSTEDRPHDVDTPQDYQALR